MKNPRLHDRGFSFGGVHASYSRPSSIRTRRGQAALEKLSVGRTTLIIAHRLSTIRNADLIAYIDGEGIREMGTHAELLEKDGYYAKLHAATQALQ